jgi:pyruvate dehydrogenase E1 component beta subunit
MYMNVPGLKVVMPSNAYDGKGLLKTAIRSEDPVIFCEDRTVMGARGLVPEDEYTVPLGVADVKREGTDVTIVALGGMVPRSLEAAEVLAGEGISVEVVDPRSLVPLDKATILESVAKTGRLVTVDMAHQTCSAASEIAAIVAMEGDPRSLVPLDKATILESVAKTGRLVTVDMAHQTCSAASEIAAIVAMEGFWSLQAPIQRLATPNIHIPFSTSLEPLCYPTSETIAQAVRTTLE